MSWETAVIAGELILTCGAIIYAIGRNSAVFKAEIQRVEGRLDGHEHMCHKRDEAISAKFDDITDQLNRSADTLGQNTVTVARLEGYLKTRD